MSHHKRSNSHVNFVKTKLNFAKFKEMDEECYKPDNYFNLEINPIMGKGHKGPRFDDKSLISHSVVGFEKYREFQNQNKSPSRAATRMSFRINKNFQRAPTANMGQQSLFKVNTNQSQSVILNQSQNGNFQIINHMELEQLYKTIHDSISTNPIKVQF